MARKQRQFSAQFKFETVMEVLRGEKPTAQVCRERDITDSLVYKWKQEFLDKAPGLFESKQAERIAELERLVGQLTMENALLKKGASWLEAAGGKTGCDRQLTSRSAGEPIVRGIRLCA
jgi:transposase